MEIVPSKFEDAAPLYKKYPRQTNPQDAYIELDCRTGSLSADWNGVIGTAIPFSVYHGHERRYEISPYISGAQLTEFLNDPETVALAQRIIDGYESVWNGNNHVAALTEDAQEAEEELINRIPDTEHIEPVTIWDEEYCYEARKEITAETSDDDLDKWVSEIEEAAAAENGAIEIDLEEFANKRRYELRRQKLTDDPDVSGFQNPETDTNENPVYLVEREDGKKYRLFYGPDGQIKNEEAKQ